MDQKAAEEYFAALLKRLTRKSWALDRLFWIPLLGFLSYFAFNSGFGAALGASVGWSVCAILTKLDEVTKEIWHVEYLRHLYEHTDEADAGRRRFDREKALETAMRRWWEF